MFHDTYEGEIHFDGWGEVGGGQSWYEVSVSESRGSLPVPQAVDGENGHGVERGFKNSRTQLRYTWSMVNKLRVIAMT